LKRVIILADAAEDIEAAHALIDTLAEQICNEESQDRCH